MPIWSQETQYCQIYYTKSYGFPWARSQVSAWGIMKICRNFEKPPWGVPNKIILLTLVFLPVLEGRRDKGDSTLLHPMKCKLSLTIFSAEALPFCAREIKTLACMWLGIRSMTEHVLESLCSNFPQWRFGWVGMLHSSLLQSSSLPTSIGKWINSLHSLLSRSITYIHSKVRPGCSQYMYLDLRFMTQTLKKKSVWSVFVILKMWWDSYFYWSLSIPWRGVGKTELFVQDTLNHVGPFGEWGIEQSEESTWQQGVSEALSFSSVSGSRELYTIQYCIQSKDLIFLSLQWKCRETAKKPMVYKKYKDEKQRRRYSVVCGLWLSNQQYYSMTIHSIQQMSMNKTAENQI